MTAACARGCYRVRYREGERVRTPRPAQAGLLCFPCFDRLATMLDDIDGYLDLLPHVRERGVADAMHNPGVKLRSVAGEHAPLNLAVTALTDRRTTQRLVEHADGTVSNEGPISVPAVLASWCQVVLTERRLAETVHTIRRCLQVLQAHVDWCAEQDWAAEMWAEIDEVHKQLGEVVGEPRPRPVGRCPEDDCDTPLYLPEEGQPLVCRGCGSSWDRSMWGVLADVIAADESAKRGGDRYVVR